MIKDGQRMKRILLFFTLFYVIGGALALFLSIVFGFNKEHFGFAFLIGGLVPFILLRRGIKEENWEKRLESELDRSRLYLKFGFMLFLICISIILLEYGTWSEDYSLQIWFFIIVAVAASIIMIQIGNLKQGISWGATLIIIEIMILTLTISTSFQFLFATPYGNDSIYHIGFIEQIISKGSTSGYPGSYGIYPEYHILFANLMEIPNMGIMEALLSMSVIQIVFGIFLFLVIRKPLGNRIALISMLLVSIVPNFFVSRYSFYPGGYSAIFLLFMIYMIQRREFSSRTSIVALFLILSFEVVAFHPLLPIFLLAIFILMSLGQRTLSGRKTPRSTSKIIPSTSIIIIALLTLFWWMQPTEGGGIDIFTAFIRSAIAAFTKIDSTNVNQATLAPTLPYEDILLSDLGFAALILIAIVGAFLALGGFQNNRTVGNDNDHIIRIASIATLALIPVPFILAIVYPNSLPSRWFPFLEILCSLCGGISIFYATMMISKKKLRMIFSFFFFILVFFLISSPVVNPNGSIYASDISSRSGLTSPELHAAQFLNSQNASEINADSSYVFLNFTGRIDPENSNTFSYGLTVIREYIIKKGFNIPLFGQGALMKIVRANENFNQTLSMMNIVYDIGSVVAYQRK